MRQETAKPSLPFGLFELDDAGHVLYYRPEREGSSSSSNAEMIGSNFFTDVPIIANVREFQEHLRSFHLSHAPADSFPYTFSLEGGQLRTKVLLARIRERSSPGMTDSILVHIRET